jgi:tetratricopeptide (TPR) repeat protein
MPRASFEQAVGWLREGRWLDAERACLDVLTRDPRHAGAMLGAGEAALRTGKLQVAAQRLLEGAAAGGPQAVQGVLDAFDRALAAEPGRADLHHWHGEVLESLGRVDEAIAAFRRGIDIDAEQPGTYFCLGEALMRRAVPDEAVAAYRAVIRLVGERKGYSGFLARAYAGLGFALLVNGEPDDAIDAFRRALTLEPTPARHGQVVFHLQYSPVADAEAILREAREWDRAYAAPLRPTDLHHRNDRSPERRLRIGYVSSDFRVHTHNNFLPPLFERHDRERFEILAYSNVAVPDDVTARVRARADRWCDISNLDDVAAARRIREDAVDVLVDLTMHTGGERLRVFARKPAPVQVCWLAYPGTTGVAAIDYRVTDPHLDPPENDGEVYDRAYVERPLRLADTFWCYRPQLPSAEVGPLPAREAGCVTFGCMNNFAKVTGGVLDLWARVLSEVEGSRCLLLVPSREARRRVHRRMSRAGVDPDRVEFVGRQPLPEFLANYRRIDIGLDTLPYGGHTTSLEAFYMGVPVVTQVGRTIVGRAGLGFATNLGLPELVASTEDDYVRIAAELARDLDRLAEMRVGLRARMQASPLMDEARFVEQIECAYRDAWRRWCATAR